ncbi:MAG: hypothetical protein AB7J13_07165 [Pyrinomonadaceae bacterium]
MKISRRKFLVAAPVVAGAVTQFNSAAFGQSAERPTLPPIGDDELAKLTWDSFYPFQNTDFDFYVSGEPVSLRLLSMADSRPKGTLARKGQECFMLKFQGPFRRRLEQGTYDVNHFRLGDFKLFITDGGLDGRKQFYVAIINRMVG